MDLLKSFIAFLFLLSWEYASPLQKYVYASRGFNSIDLVNVSMAKAKKSAGAQRSAVLILLCNFKVLSFCLPKMGAFIYRTNSIWCYNPCGGTVAANLYLCQKKILGRIQS